MGLLTDLGIDKTDWDEARDSTVGDAFELMPSGAYAATVDSIWIYRHPMFDNLWLQVNIKVNENDRIVSYRKDVSKETKEGKANQGFLSRLKSIQAATGVSEDKMKLGKKETIKIFGKDANATEILGANGKALTALVRLSCDTNKAEGESYRETNDIEGVCANNDNETLDKFAAKVEKTPVFNYKGKAKAKAAASTPSAESQSAIDDVL